MRIPTSQPLRGARVAVTRPVGAGRSMRDRVIALGGDAVSLPGSTLRAVGDKKTALAPLCDALRGDIVVFASPAAVRFAARLKTLRTRALVIAPGPGTAVALRRAGIGAACVPSRHDSEGVLALPALRHLGGKCIGIVGAAGGRGLLQRELRHRGASIREAHVYQRVAARLDRRHAQSLLRRRGKLYVPLSSTEGLRNLVAILPEESKHALLAGIAVASSERLARAARHAGFANVLRAASAHPSDLIDAVVAAHGRRR